MSTISAANISDGTDTVGTEYVVNGSAKVWINYNAILNPAVIRDSLNVSSLSDIGVGTAQITYSSSLTGEFSNIIACSQSGRSTTQRSMAYDSTTANSFILGTFIDVGSTQSASDNTFNDAMVFGELA